MQKDKNKIATDTYEKIADIYTKQYFNDFSDIKYVDKFLELLPNKAKVLDVGSGPGQFAKYLFSKGFEIIGIDMAQKMLEISKERVPEVVFKKMDMRNLSFAGGEFDGLLVAYSLIHIPSNDILKTLAGFKRVLKRGGFIELITQKGDPDKIISEPFMPSEKMFFNFFTKERISSYLNAAGFEVVFQEDIKSPDPNSVGTRIIYTIAKKP